MNVDQALRATAFVALLAAPAALYALRLPAMGRPATPTVPSAHPPDPDRAPRDPRPPAPPRGKGTREPSPGPAPAAPSPIETPRSAIRFAAAPADPADNLGVVPLPEAPHARRGGARRGAEVIARAPMGPCGGVVVRAITASPDPAWAFASLASSATDPAELRRVGEAFGSWRVASIEWDRVWLQGAGSRCAVPLSAGAAGEPRRGVPTSPSAAVIVAATEPLPTWAVPAEIAQRIRRRSETELVVDPSAVERIFRQAPELLAETRLDPVSEDTGVVGVQIGSVQGDSLLGRLGLESGDVLRALDDHRVASLDAAVALLAAARTRGHLVARVERAGQQFDLTVVAREVAFE